MASIGNRRRRGTLWTPAMLAVAPAGWWDAADIDTITQSSGSVSAWKNKGSAGGNAAQATGANQPTFLQAARSGLPGVVFNGTSTRLQMSSVTGLPTGSTAGSLIVCGYKAVSATWQKTVRYAQRALSITGSDGIFVEGPGTSVSPGVLWGVGDATWIGTCPSGTGTTLSSFNGSVFTQTVTNNGGTSTLGFLGCSEAQNEFFNGVLQEVLILAGVLSTIERQKLEGYLAWKWRTVYNLPASHPYKYTPPTTF